MELKSGHKEKDAGVVPVGWKPVKLGEIFDFKNGLNKAKQFFGYGTPIVNYMDIYSRPGLYPKDIRGRVDVNKKEMESFGVRKGDVFFTRTSETVDEIGISSVVLADVKNTVFSGFILRGRPKNNYLDDYFKKYCFSSRFVREQIISKSTYTTRALTNGRVLSAITLLLPPKKEQVAITTALSDVDALIASLDKLIAKKRAIKTAAMQQLLTGKKRLPGFDGEWEVKRLGELLAYEQPTKYLVSNSEYSDANDVPVLTAGKTFVLGYTSENDGVYDNLPVIIFDDFTTANKYVTFPFKAKSSAMKLLRPRNQSVNLRLVYEMMQLIEFKLGDHKRYWISEYQKLEIKIPGADEQTAIANVLFDMDTEITALESRLNKTKATKQGMMQELLTGRTRLI